MLNKYPFTKQQSNKDCGVAALQMIIKYYKGYVELEELRNLSKTNKDGTTAYHLIETAKKLGFEAYGVKCHLDDLNSDNLMLPCIAHVNLENKYQHFIVIYEVDFKKKYFIIADPATKKYKISFEKFKCIWNETLIFFYPIERIPFNKNKINNSYFIKQLLVQNKKRIFKIILLSAIVTFLSILTSFYFKFMIDNVIDINAKSKLYFLFFAFLTIIIIKIITIYFRNKLLILYDKIVSNHLSNSLFNQIISLPYHYYSNRTPGEIISYFDHATNIKDTIIKSLILFLIDIPLAILSYILIYLINKEIAFITLLTLMLNILIIIIFNNNVRESIKKVQKGKAITTSHLIESISGFETIKGINLLKRSTLLFKKKYRNLVLKLYDMDNIQNNQSIILELISQMSEYLIIFMGCLFVLDNHLSIGQLLVLNNLYMYVLIPFSSLPLVLVQYIDSKNAFQKLTELFYYEKMDEPFKLIPKGQIAIRNLNFSYDNINKHLKNINLDIKEGEKVMLIGSSGSGKSTLLKILMKYYKVINKSIMINNDDINNYNSIFYHEYVSYISQNEILFNGTFYDNLSVNNNENDILEISKLCYVDEIINNSLGYNTLIEENGFNISGGERQRIILARTLMKEFNILLIDEGLSQMDNNLERKILKNIFNKYSKKTMIITSHRLENIDLFDKVIQMEKGRIKNIMVRNE